MRNRGFFTKVLIASLSVVALSLGLAQPAGASSAPQAPSGLSTAFPPAARAPGIAAKKPSIAAKAAYMVDRTSGTVLYSKNADMRVPVASLTKVMTAYVVRRVGSLDDVITITEQDVRRVVNNNATHAGLRAGERLTTRELLYALMLPSAADAANALARRYGPGTTRFTARMNAAARDLGLNRTRYMNADGLGQGGVSTARDQTRLAVTALRDPVIRRVAGTLRYRVSNTGGHRAHVWENSNDLLTKVPGAFGLKTGFTKAAGGCLAFAATRGGHTLVGTLLGDINKPNRFRTAARLLDIVKS